MVYFHFIHHNAEWIRSTRRLTLWNVTDSRLHTALLGTTETSGITLVVKLKAHSSYKVYTTIQFRIFYLRISRLNLQNLYIGHFYINLIDILYVYRTWSLTLRKEHRLTVFENRVLRRIFGHKREKVLPRSYGHITITRYPEPCS
jgi:hypothetical protein